MDDGCHVKAKSYYCFWADEPKIKELYLLKISWEKLCLNID